MRPYIVITLLFNILLVFAVYEVDGNNKLSLRKNHISLPFNCSSSNDSDTTYIQIFKEKEIKKLQIRISRIYYLLGFVVILFLITSAIIFIRHNKKKKFQMNQLSTISRCEKKQISQDIELFNALQALMYEEKIFKNYGITLDSLAIRMNVSRNRLSHTINNYTGKNFNQYINEYRIKEILKMMSESNYKHMSIEEIAEQGGFNSRSSFYKAFKDITGQTPSQFKSKTSS
ncbi:hypothetical protein FACS1894155_03610 [Bacteroidia bacterium]|nr:hypothetical protein FACS1894155_03610 [Bacteroidia bacterium]